MEYPDDWDVTELLYLNKNYPDTVFSSWEEYLEHIQPIDNS